MPTATSSTTISRGSIFPSDETVAPLLPILIVFLVCQKWVVRGVVMSGLKG